MEIHIGTITHFYTRLSVAVLDLTDEIHVGDEIRIKGRITDLIMTVASLEVDHNKIESASQGMEVALLVDGYVREGDGIYKMV